LIAPCEVAVKTVSPALRALLAQTLLDKHELKEVEVAHVLGISQSAVSKYSKKVRGTTIPIGGIPEIQTITDQMATMLLSDQVQQTEVMKLFCQACALIRSKGLMCELCRQNQNPGIDGCDFCRSL
jgi:hypothetical protein